MGMSSSAFWFHIRLTGEDTAGQDLVLSLDSPALDRIEFYFVRDDQLIQKSVLGDSIPTSQQSYPYRIPIVPFEQAPQGSETQVYIRVTSSSGIEIPLTLTTMGLLAVDQQGPLVILGAFFAFLFLCFAASAILYFYLSHRQFLAYALFFGGMIVYFLTTTGMGRVWFWGDTAEINTRLSYVATAFIIMSLYLIGQYLRFDHRYRDSVNLILRFLSYAMLPVAVIFLIVPSLRLPRRSCYRSFI
jgi:hypothetical protein